MLTAVLLLLLGTATPPVAAVEEHPGAGLPPPECLRQLRGARIARMRGDSTLELETLRDAARSVPREVAPIHALLDFNRRQPLPDDELERLYGRLRRLLGDPEYEVSAGALAILVRDPAAEHRTLRLVLEQIGPRIAATAEPRPE